MLWWQRRASPAFGTERRWACPAVCQSVCCQQASEPGAETSALIWLPLACFMDEQDETKYDITMDIFDIWASAQGTDRLGSI